MMNMPQSKGSTRPGRRVSPEKMGEKWKEESAKSASRIEDIKGMSRHQWEITNAVLRIANRNHEASFYRDTLNKELQADDKLKESGIVVSPLQASHAINNLIHSHRLNADKKTDKLYLSPIMFKLSNLDNFISERAKEVTDLWLSGLKKRAEERAYPSARLIEEKDKIFGFKTFGLGSKEPVSMR
jgi:hypothetical protein